MEYYTFCTYSCNLSCGYCSAKQVVKNNKELLHLTDDQLGNIVNYIRKDISNRNEHDNSIIFFGGEPLLVLPIIEKFINKTLDLNLQYIIYTNGLLLDSVPSYLLQLINIFFISIDGTKETHEKHRGIGTYDKILSNVKKIKNEYHGHLIGRITIEEDVNVYQSVINLLNIFDSIHWQIVNKPNFNQPEKFIHNYKTEIRQLVDYWYTKFEKGEILRIIPFQAIIQSLLLEVNSFKKSFRCGVGRNFQVIDIDGNIYECDEFVGEQNKCIGNIENGVINIEEAHTEIFENCKTCTISNICLGRCKKCLKVYNHAHVENYCSLTKILVEILLEYLPKIKFVMQQKALTPQQIFNGPYCTEEIP